MQVIDARNVNEAYAQGVLLLHKHGIPEDSRAGEVLRFPGPVTTVYRRPCERVLFDPDRNANPFFHLVESLWMLGGRDDLDKLTPYVSRMKDFSDDGGVTQPGAYGKRWRDWHVAATTPENYARFDWPDQLNWVVKRLRDNQFDRRTVIQMWDPSIDIAAADAGGNDVPCNLTAAPYVAGGHLCLTVFCRSNDAIWGAYGANAVHFSVLLEYLAGRIGLPVGTYTQVSNNFHGYLKTLPTMRQALSTSIGVSPYHTGLVEPLSMFDGWTMNDDAMSDQKRERLMQEDLRIFFEHGATEAVTKARWPFMRHVAAPMAIAHQHWKKTKGNDRYLGAQEILQQVRAVDWRLAALEWVDRLWTKGVDLSVKYGKEE